jgi:hypothetical protein
MSQQEIVERREQEQRELAAIQQAFREELEQQLVWMRELPQEALTRKDLRFLQDDDRQRAAVDWIQRNYLSSITQLQNCRSSVTGVYGFVQNMLDGYWTKGCQEKVLIMAATKAVLKQQNKTGDWVHQQQFSVRNKAFQVMQWTVGGIVAVPVAVLFTALAVLSVVLTRSTGAAAALFKGLGYVICGIGYGAGYLCGKPRKMVQFDRVFQSKPASKREPRFSFLNEADWRGRQQAGWQSLPDGESVASVSA